MRAGGKAYLRKKPESFGGGIDPESGVRYKEGKRVSVVAEQEKIKKAEAEKIQKQAEEFRQQEIQRQAGIKTQQEQQKTIQEQIKKIQLEKKPLEQYGTRTDLAPDKIKYDIKLQPYYEKRVVDTHKDVKTGREIPITKIFHVDPTGRGKQKEREVTEAERKEFEEKTVEVIIPKERGLLETYSGRIADTYSRAERRIAEAITKPIATGIGMGFEAVGAPSTLEEARANIPKSTKTLEEAGVPSWIAKSGEFIAGVGAGIAQDVIDKPLKQVVLFGAGYGIGVGVEAVSLGASAVSVRAVTSTSEIIKSAGRLLPKATSYGINIAGVGLGGAYVYKVGTDISQAGTVLEKGEIFGVASKDIGLLGLGGSFGKAGTQRVYDIFRTRDRVELPTQDIGIKQFEEVLTGKDSFVESKHFGYTGQAGKEKQIFDIKIFERAGRSYHATPQQFWSKEFVTTKGTSEFPGLYTAPSPSVYFLKAGETPTKFFGLYKGGSSPSLARIYGKGFSITEQSKAGVGYVTGVKPEIEAVFPVGDKFLKTGTETFFEYGGRKIPMDTFKYSEELTALNKKLGLADGVSISDISKSYSYYVGGKSIISPDVSIGAVLVSSSDKISEVKQKYYTPSIKTSVSKPSYKPSEVVSYKPSSSKPSYKPSEVVSYKPSVSKPSYKPSDVVSYKASVSKPSYRPSYRPSYYEDIFRSVKTPVYFKFKPTKLPTTKRGLYGVEVRRFGEFRPVGIVKDIQTAFALGRKRVSETLAATFKVSGKGLQLKTPTGFYRKLTKKGETVFIEKKEKRLSKIGEIMEIQLAKKRKKRRKKK